MLRVAIAVGISTILAGCSFEPPLQIPPPPATQAYVPGKQTLKTASIEGVGNAGVEQDFQYGAKIEADWWRLYSSPQINGLVDSAVTHNPTIQSALAALDEAHQNLLANAGIFWPQVTLNGGAERERTSGAQFGGTGASEFSLYTGQVSVSYIPDIFGLNAMVYQSSKAQEDAARYNLQEAYLTLEGNTVATAIQAASLYDQIQTTKALIANGKEILSIIQGQYQAGAINYLDVLNQETQLANTEAQLPPLEQSLAAAENALAALTGNIPSQADLPALDMQMLKLPGDLPVSLPSTLVRQRPDILSSEEQIRSANAQVGEAVAERFPLVQITGNLGYQSGKLYDLFDPASIIGDIAADATVTLFDGGTLEAQQHAAEAALRIQVADYQSTLLSAFEQVSNALRAVEHDAQTLQYDEQAYNSALNAFDLAQHQYTLGAINYLTLLVTQTQYQQARLALISSAAQRYEDTAALFVALGGGWWPEQYNSDEQNADKAAATTQNAAGYSPAQAMAEIQSDSNLRTAGQ
jgi:NodT family efflux transporter outer membrane factor (OMF) lipoprotein